MKLIFALGNSEEKYDGTRHNVGFAVLDNWAKDRGGEFQEKSRFKASLAEITIDGEKILLAKPATFYNLVGESYRLLTNFYQIEPSDVLVIADDLALPFGTLRMRVGGRDAGNNGIKSLNAHGGEQTNRLRIGIANDLCPKIDDADFVLSKFSADERAELPKLQSKVSAIIDSFLNDSFEKTTHR